MLPATGRQHYFRANILKFSAIIRRVVWYLYVVVELAASIFRVGSLLLDYLDPGASKYLLNVITYLPVYTVSHHKHDHGGAFQILLGPT